jgi:transcriptional regulator with XRE-family HTH domain
MELVRPLHLVDTEPLPEQAPSDRSALASARLQRRLTVEEAAKRAGVTPEQVEWLEQGRVYRFPSVDHALEVAMLVTTALEIDRLEARRLAGLSVPPRPLGVNPSARLVVVAAISAALMGILAFVVVPVLRPPQPAPVDPIVAQAASLPKPWEIQVHVLNGAGDIGWTRQVASTIQSLAYTVKEVRRADRFDYPRTAVYYPPGHRLIAVRLARQLGVVTMPLPGGKDENRLVVIVGPQRGPG